MQMGYLAVQDGPTQPLASLVLVGPHGLCIVSKSPVYYIMCLSCFYKTVRFRPCAQPYALGARSPPRCILTFLVCPHHLSRCALTFVVCSPPWFYDNYSTCLQYLTESVLVGKRVSALSVGLACLTSCADLAPSLLPSLAPYLPFTVHPDPKLKSRSAKVYKEGAVGSSACYESLSPW